MNHEVELYVVLQLLQKAGTSDISGQDFCCSSAYGVFVLKPAQDISSTPTGYEAVVVFVFLKPSLFQALPVALSLALGIAL